MSFCLFRNFSNFHSIFTCNISGCFVIKVVATLKMNDMFFTILAREKRTNIKLENLPWHSESAFILRLSVWKGNGKFRKNDLCCLLNFLARITLSDRHENWIYNSTHFLIAFHFQLNCCFLRCALLLNRNFSISRRFLSLFL